MKCRKKIIARGLFLLEIVLVFSLFSLFGYGAIAGLGDNVTVITQLDVGNVYPEVLNVSINDDASAVTLTANTTTMVYCMAVIRDYNGEDDINATRGNISAVFYDSNGFTHASSDDNNSHYTAPACTINESFGSYNGFSDDAYSLLANCSFNVQYYANPDTWNCNVTVNDSYNWQDWSYDNITVSELISIGLPTTIDYGTVNATYVSDEQQAEVTNFGNVQVNLSLSAYAVTEGDGYAMNCTLGSVQNISSMYEKYNLTGSTAGDLTLGQFEGNYTNVTDSPTLRDFQLDYNQNETVNNATKPTYWRIYVPIGVAGSCTGNILFGATKAVGT